MSGLTPYVIFVSFAAVLGSFQYGYHIGELNTPQSIMSCQGVKIPNPEDSEYLPPCIKMNAAQFAFVTSVFTLGGLVGSLFASRVADSQGRRKTLILNGIFLALGPLVMGFATNITALVIGRAIAGIGSGVVTVVVPAYLAEISTLEFRGTFGVMNQLGIVCGILFSQVEGLYLSTIPGWRLILLSGFLVSIVQTTFLLFSVESPRFLASKPGGYNSAKRALQKLRGSIEVEDELSGWRQVASEEGLEGLISEEEREQNLENNDDVIRESPAVVFHARNSDENFNFWKLISNPHYFPALKVLILAQLTQQLSGVNGVMFYSTSILSKIFPTMSDLITVFISIVNVFMTVVSAYLIDRTGRRTLLLYSSGLMGLCSAILALSLDNNFGFLSAISIIGFVAAFAIGLGPIPFLIIPEIFDTKATATAASLGLTLNWFSSFLVAFLFPILNEQIGGNVFFIFALYLFMAFIAIKRFVPETKAKTVEEVWRGWTGKVID
ncbi:21084_t:CDS:2 [Dentiscutata erythropus]|uniref:21084_t:CDS:1 n=1 Tax=Dentiscutata erythropus TaxID=1348616 RepID=A0A9N9GI40_9GLOM|nr:21084_t:CDS:2 [Dentiscutata erythropus]